MIRDAFEIPRQERHLTTTGSNYRFISLTCIIFCLLVVIIITPPAILAIEVTDDTEDDDTDCVDFRMILVFEDRPDDITISLRTTAVPYNEVQHYWKNYIPYSNSKKESTSTLFEEICLPRNACYLFQVIDKGKISGWGTSMDNESNTTTATTTTDATSPNRAFFSLFLEDNFIGVYDSDSGGDDNSCFSVQWYQFGYSCLIDDATTANDEERNNVANNITELTVNHGSVPCRTSTTNSNGTIPSSNTTIEFQGPALTNEPSSAPMLQLIEEQSDTPSVSSTPSLIPTTQPSISAAPSLISVTSNTPITPDNIQPAASDFPSSVSTIRPSTSKIPSLVPAPVISNTPIAPDNIRPAITMPPNFASSDAPSFKLFSSSTVPSDVPSIFPSIVPTAKCIEFYITVRLDNNPEDMILSLAATNEYGSDDDVVIWDKIRPWDTENGSNNTYITNQIVNQTSCIYAEECYTLIVEDSAKDGLTSLGESDSDEKMSGYYTLSYDTDRIISYYDGNVDGCYRKKIYKFGLSANCVMTEITEPNDRSCPKVRRRR